MAQDNINFVEMACEIGDYFLEALTKQTGIEYWTTTEDGDNVLTPQGQEIFDAFYGRVIEYLEKSLS